MAHTWEAEVQRKSKIPARKAATDATKQHIHLFVAIFPATVIDSHQSDTIQMASAPAAFSQESPAEQCLGHYLDGYLELIHSDHDHGIWSCVQPDFNRISTGFQPGLDAESEAATDEWEDQQGEE